MFLNLLGARDQKNTIEILIQDNEETSLFENWSEMVALLLERLSAEIFNTGGDMVLQQHQSRLANHPRLLKVPATKPITNSPIIPMQINLGTHHLSFFSTLTSFGTVQEVSLSSTKIEMPFPADQETKVWVADNVQILTQSPK
ncbi:MAG: MmyB family transcriptional regulator [bacterium]